MTYQSNLDTQTVELSIKNLKKYKIISNLPFDNWAEQSLRFKYNYPIDEIIEDLLSNPLISFLSINAELVNQSINQTFKDSINVQDELTYKIYNASNLERFDKSSFDGQDICG